MAEFDPCAEMAVIDNELRALLQSSPKLAEGHEAEVKDLGIVIYLPRSPTKEEWERALRMGKGD
jgi:hypothetical protein